MTYWFERTTKLAIASDKFTDQFPQLHRQLEAAGGGLQRSENGQIGSANVRVGDHRRTKKRNAALGPVVYFRGYLTYERWIEIDRTITATRCFQHTVRVYLTRVHDENTAWGRLMG